MKEIPSYTIFRRQFWLGVLAGGGISAVFIGLLILNTSALGLPAIIVGALMTTSCVVMAFLPIEGWYDTGDV
jgi:hypothetical protein